MNPLIKQLGTYAAYHRDPRNIATHLIGVPSITFAVVLYLSRPLIDLGPVSVSLAWLLIPIVALGLYFRLDFKFGLTMTAALVAMAFGAAPIARQSLGVWLGTATAIFVVGWIIQFVGHYFEGKKPAFVDDLMGLLIGPLFIAAEITFALGLRLEVKAAVEKVAGPVRVRQLASQA